MQLYLPVWHLWQTSSGWPCRIDVAPILSYMEMAPGYVTFNVRAFIHSFIQVPKVADHQARKN
eukprot:1411858-Amphidinium_carterae.1